MPRTSSPVRLHLPALVIGAAALVASACSAPAGPTAPSPLSATSSISQGAGGAPQSSAGKVDVCHKSGRGFQLINVSANALRGHLGHGDGQPGGAVPGSVGQGFGASCDVVNWQKHTLTLVSGSSGGAGTLDSSIRFAKASGATGTAVILRTHSAYASLAGAKWVNWSIITSAFNYLYGTDHTGDDVTYSIDFTLPTAAGVSLEGTFLADNRGDAFLNGAAIGGHPASPFGAGFTEAAAVSASSGFAAGTNTLSFKVRDDGGVAGLTFSVTVTYWAP